MLNFPSRRVEVCRLTIPIQNLPKHLDGLRIVQLSDFHFGDRALPHAILEEAIAIAQKLEPDLVCYTGDFINGNPDTIEALSQKLQVIQGRLGNLAILGNHDNLTPQSAQIVEKTLEKYGIQVLNDEVIYPCGPELAFAGFTCPPYFRASDFEPIPVMTQIEEDIPRIVLLHGPGYEKYLRRWRVDLQLSGHTHGGQLALPVLGPLIPRFWQLFNLLPQSLQKKLKPRLPRRVALSDECIFFQGLHHIAQGKLYVNRGLGAHFPGRLFCPPEVTELTLVPTKTEHQLSEEDSISGDLAAIIT